MDGMRYQGFRRVTGDAGSFGCAADARDAGPNYAARFSAAAAIIVFDNTV